MTTLPMTPIPVPPEAAASRPALAALNVGPPPGVTDCGTVEVLAGSSHQGYPMFACYWRPDAEQLQALVEGGFIELIQYYPRLVMHAMTVWSATKDDVDEGSDVEELAESVTTWLIRDGWVDEAEGGPSAEALRDNLAVHLASLLVDAGWERAR